ncbi:MFS transporter [Solicola gregarius]|uniref:MFS transporter n=1 Tax=Solicola gregarius TaxID=2908642 RepID=A0AA46TKR5_9ACTN|nr:MFS transporter [Solicola gregarius]UYM07086.1 MFS transporter [Solicola gregarius]
MTTTVDNPSALTTTRGRLILALLCGVAFLDLIDATIVNIALPSIRDDLGFSVQQLQWVPSAYLLTYGGFMLLGGRAADLLGRRRVLLAGLTVFAVASLVGGLASDAGVLVGSRLAQGIGAAATMPAALSILTTTFHTRSDRNTAIGVWGGVAGLASAVGVLLGGVLTEGPGWRWVMLINPIICALLVAPVLRLLPDDRPAERRRGFDAPGAALATGAMLLLVYTLVEAPDHGWSAARTVLGLLGTAVLVALFLAVEMRSSRPLVPLSIGRVPGLLAANVVQLTTLAGFLSMFFFLTLYMENVLGFSPVKTGLAYLPVCIIVGVSAGVGSQLIVRVGTRAIIVVGSLVTAAGIFWLSRIPADGSYVTDVLPGMVVLSLGVGSLFVTVTAAANAGVEPERAGLAAALLNSSQQIGGALGLAILSAIATSRTDHLLATGADPTSALTDGFGRGLAVGAAFLVLAALLGLRTVNTRAAEA